LFNNLSTLKIKIITSKDNFMNFSAVRDNGFRRNFGFLGPIHHGIWR